MDRAVLRVVERRLLAALRRMHAAQPLQPEHRIDAVRAALREVPTARSPRHRGGTRPPIDDHAFDDALESLVAAGRVVRSGRRIALMGDRPLLGAQMRARADALLADLRAAGASPPRAEAVARRLGMPPAVLDGMRVAGELVPVAPGIDYPADLLAELMQRLTDGAPQPPTRAWVAAELGVSRRYAEALCAHLLRDSGAVR